MSMIFHLKFSPVSLSGHWSWNAKKICIWLNAAATAIVCSLVPMMYRLVSTIVSTQVFKGV